MDNENFQIPNSQHQQHDTNHHHHHHNDNMSPHMKHLLSSIEDSLDLNKWSRSQIEFHIKGIMDVIIVSSYKSKIDIHSIINLHSAQNKATNASRGDYNSSFECCPVPSCTSTNFDNYTGWMTHVASAHPELGKTATDGSHVAIPLGINLKQLKNQKPTMPSIIGHIRLKEALASGSIFIMAQLHQFEDAVQLVILTFLAQWEGSNLVTVDFQMTLNKSSTRIVHGCPIDETQWQFPSHLKHLHSELIGRYGIVFTPQDLFTIFASSSDDTNQPMVKFSANILAGNKPHSLLSSWTEIPDLHPNVEECIKKTIGETPTGIIRVIVPTICSHPPAAIFQVRDCIEARLSVLTPLINSVYHSRLMVNGESEQAMTKKSRSLHEHNRLKPILIIIIPTNLIAVELARMIRSKFQALELQIYDSFELHDDLAQKNAIGQVDIILTTTARLFHLCQSVRRVTLDLQTIKHVVFWGCETLLLGSSKSTFSNAFQQLECGVNVNTNFIFQFNELHDNHKEFIHQALSIQVEKDSCVTVSTGPVDEMDFQQLSVSRHQVNWKDKRRYTTLRAVLLREGIAKSRIWIIPRCKGAISEVMECIPHELRHATFTFTTDGTINPVEDYDRKNAITRLTKCVIVTTNFVTHSLDFQPPELIILYNLPKFKVDLAAILRFALRCPNPKPILITMEGVGMLDESRLFLDSIFTNL